MPALADSPPAALPALGTIVLAGNPNSGKTTVFNCLTGLRQKVANYPGVTVEKKMGRCQFADGRVCEVVDLPGTYSLVPHSPDEEVAMQVLRGLRPDTSAPSAIVAVVDASNLPRSLYLVSQLLDLGTPLIIALNMTDIADRRGLGVDVQALARALGVAVVPLVGNRGRGIDDLKRAILVATPGRPLSFTVGEDLPRAIDHVAQAIPLPVDAGTGHAHGVARRLLIGDRHGIAGLEADPGVSAALAHARTVLAGSACDPLQVDIEARYRWIDQVVAQVIRPAATGTPTALTERVDAVLVHRVWGLLIFAIVMGTLFISIFTLAKPIMDALNDGISWLGDHSTSGLNEGPLKSLLNDGVFKGVGTVIVFVPQIAMLFFFLAVLEDSGYLARAAFLMDRLLAKVGLHGKSFIPLLSSFACAIPGVMAARTIDRPRERLATILVAPFMSCSARLPVYTLVIGAFFSGFGDFRNAIIKGLIMLGCYALGIIAAAATSLACRWLLGRGEVSPFILEMPSYKLPQLSEVARQVWSNTSQFLTKAGTTIFCLSVLLWALAYFPRLPSEREEQVRAQATREASAAPAAGADTKAPDHPSAPAAPSTVGALSPVVPPPVASEPAASTDGSSTAASDGAGELHERINDAVAGEQLAYSWAGRLGHAIEPVISPLGFDWKMGVGLVAAFAAREVFVSTMGIVYSVGESEEHKERIQDAMLKDRTHEGRLVWTPVVALSLLVWFVLAMQCMSTFAVVRRETGGWKWPVFQLVYMNVLAYAASLVTYQVGIRLFS